MQDFISTAFICHLACCIHTENVSITQVIRKVLPVVEAVHEFSTAFYFMSSLRWNWTLERAHTDIIDSHLDKSVLM